MLGHPIFFSSQRVLEYRSCCCTSHAQAWQGLQLLVQINHSIELSQWTYKPSCSAPAHLEHNLVCTFNSKHHHDDPPEADKLAPGVLKAYTAHTDHALEVKCGAVTSKQFRGAMADVDSRSQGTSFVEIGFVFCLDGLLREQCKVLISHIRECRSCKRRGSADRVCTSA